jgi:hypothetical protein
MDNEKNCWTCRNPISKDLNNFGTNEDGSFNEDYCSICFQNGKLTEEGISQKEETKKRFFKNMDRIHIDLIAAYNHEIQRLIGTEFQQLLVMLYFQGDEFAQTKIQEYCYKILKNKNLLWHQHRGDYHKIHLLENCKYSL